MRRREFITLIGGAAVWPLAARAQQGGKVWRIGLLSGTSPEGASPNYDAFLQGMRELGYAEGRDFILEARFAGGRYERFPELASELVRLKVDVLVTGTAAAIRTLQHATTTIPIVLAYSTDPVGNGFVASFARPGGNITGLSGASDDTSPKQLELVRAAVPQCVSYWPARESKQSNLCRRSHKCGDRCPEGWCNHRAGGSAQCRRRSRALSLNSTSSACRRSSPPAMRLSSRNGARLRAWRWQTACHRCSPSANTRRLAG